MKSSALYPYQREAVKHILKFNRCALFLDMGLGKTATTLTAIRILIMQGEISKVLIVAPLRVARATWSAEVAIWEHLKGLKIAKILGTPEARMAALAEDADIYLINRENILWLSTQKHSTFDMIVIDELSSFKSPKAKRFKCMKKLAICAHRFVGLTGTPAPNSLLDLWAQIYLIDGGARLGKSITAYKARYFYPLITHNHVVYKYGLREGAEEEIHTAVKDICISMNKSDYLALPPLIERQVRVELTDEERAQYRKMIRTQVLTIGNEVITSSNAGVLAGKLCQLANGAIYAESGKVVEVHRAKLDRLKEIVDDTQGNVLIAYAYRHDRARIMETLKSYEPREIETEEDVAQWNNGEVKVLIGHPASIGHGLNLQRGGNVIIFFGLTWSFELYSQFLARLHRNGQTKPVVVNILTTAGTIDEKIYKALKNKELNQQQLIDAVKWTMQ